MRRLPAALGSLVVLLLLTACAHSATPTASRPPPSASAPTSGPLATATSVDGGCVRPADHARLIHLKTALGPTPGVLLGAGHRGVLITHASDGDLCQMLPLARLLATHGFLVLDWDPAISVVTETATATQVLREGGATHVVLAGASYGAKAALIAATRITPRVDGVLTLSAEEYLSEQPVAPAVSRLRVPVLFVTARQDPYGSAQATSTFLRICPSAHKSAVRVPGSAHGIDLLTGSHRARITAAILQFVDRFDR